MAVNTQIVETRQLPKILIVEDNARYAFELMRVFKDPSKEARFDVDVVATVEQAMVYVDRDSIDIYVVDLRLPMGESDLAEKVQSGKQLVRLIVDRSNAGIIVHSNIPMGRDAEELFRLGADDYLEKGNKPEFVRAKAEALWRRIVMTRPNTAPQFVHTNRVFRIGQWRFVIGKRDLNTETGNSIRLSPTEHAFLRYLCTVEDHEISRRDFNVGILGRAAYEEDRRIDNLVYRIREKLGDDIRLISKRDGIYRLMDVTEIRSQQKT